ncbi:MAG: J domain-containing protein [Pseudomonadota bacterium]
MADSEYKPRLGFDIRVRPSKSSPRKPRRKAPEEKHICEFEGCTEFATVRVAQSPREPNVKIWLCAAHAAAHNKSWNYFDGMSSEEAQKAKEAAQYGDRPTWAMGKNERAAAAARARGPADMDDAHGLFKDAAAAQTAARGTYRDGRQLPRLQVKAFETLDLKVTAPSSEIRKRYAELVRRFHPDSNGGDRSAETQLQEVVKAHQILKKAGLC